MENQHRQIPGYRDLTQDEINMIRDLKSVSASLDEMIKELQTTPDLDQRCVSLAKTNLQQGMM